jgi:RNA polymerase sigma-70 factor (ECF subfamily)
VSPFLLRRCSDEVLGGRLASGEAAAFDELYRRYVHRLAAYGAHLLGDAAAGDDVAQSALLKAYNALRAGSVPDRVKPWLYRIAHNTAIDLVARRREIPSAALPERPAANGHDAGALVAALAALPDRQRRVYVLRELHGLRIDETATELDLTTAQVEQSLFAARNRLAELLVFGDRLNCVTVQRLAAGPLDPDERRALKTHLHSCAACRSELGMRGRAIGLLPEHAFDWLRGLFATLAGGGAPAAAKVGALVASASFVAGAPITVERVNHRAPLPHPAVTAVPTQHRKEVAHRAAPAVAAAVVSAPIVVAPPAPSPARHHERRRRRDDHEEHTVVTTTTAATVTTTSSTEVETATTPEASPATPPATTGDGGGGEIAPATVTPPPSQTTTTVSDDHSGGDGGSSGSGSDGGSGGGHSGKD